ncbi:MAG: RNA pseudouridine synthase [Candidatus Omnitrophica bacterium]|nr:RNA pseudouridine synthase [Candidatus Omnitrophota bacterium]
MNHHQNNSDKEFQAVRKNKISVLFENDHVVIFDKPSGMIVIPSPKNEAITMVGEVNKLFQKSSEQYKLHPCHRLDRETSGIIMFAKGKKNQQMMMDVFKEQKIEKKYIAFVQGKLNQRSGEIRGYIADKDHLKYNKDKSPKFAESRFRVLEQKKSFAIVEVQPLTGRTNQIRIQFSEMGHPIVGDRKYSVVRRFDLKFNRTALHAASLEWTDPPTNKKIKVSSTLPTDMEVFRARN